MTNKIAVAFACLGFVSAASAADINFDQGVDVKSVVEQSKSADTKFPEPGFGSHRVRYSKDCHSFSMSGGMAQTTERAYLSSTEYIEECRFVPNPPPPPPPPPVNPPNNGNNHGNNPGNNHGGQPGGNPGGNPGGQPHHRSFGDGPQDHSYPGNWGGQQGTWYCHERAGQTFRSTAQLNVPARQLFPWESENFEVCMEADRVDFATRQSPYSYSVDRQGSFDLTYNLTPGYRVPTAPDANGLSVAQFSYRDGKFVLKLNDVWAQYYAGEKVAVKVELIKDGFLFFNSSKGEKEFTVEVSPSYELVFAENELSKTRAFVDDSADTRGPKKYFVKWSFKRVGNISTQDYVNKGSTDKIPV